MLLGAVFEANDRGEAFHFAPNMTETEHDSPSWGHMMSGGLIRKDEPGGWWITDTGRARLAELEGYQGMDETTADHEFYLRQIKRFNEDEHGFSEGGSGFSEGSGFLQPNVDILAELLDLGLARRDEGGLWWITEAGRSALGGEADERADASD